MELLSILFLAIGILIGLCSIGIRLASDHFRLWRQDCIDLAISFALVMLVLVAIPADSLGFHINGGWFMKTCVGVTLVILNEGCRALMRSEIGDEAIETMGAIPPIGVFALFVVGAVWSLALFAASTAFPNSFAIVGQAPMCVSSLMLLISLFAVVYDLTTRYNPYRQKRAGSVV